MTRLKSLYRSHTCGELRSEHVDQAVTLSGWIARKRDHGGIVFYDLRDNYGTTQVVVSGDLADVARELRVESVIMVRGSVVRRAEAMVNSKIPTGEVELHVTDLKVLSEAEVLPFQVAEDDKAPEHLRLTYRFLELRRDKLHQNILLRSKVIHSMREIMTSLGFNEFQTPILTSSSPEGARDFLVPSRFHPGKFFALPQAPQQFKQLLMVAGFDRYFQIAPCFRDEDPRADRSPGEFYQCDLEMSFVEQDDVFAVGEALFKGVFTKFSNWAVTETPFPRMPYREALAKYGTDKPDLRIPYVIQDVTEIFGQTEFKVFKGEIEQKGRVCAIKVPVKDLPSRKYLDETVEFFSKLSGKGLGYLLFSADGGYKGSVAKALSEGEVHALREAVGVDGNAVVFLGAGAEGKIQSYLGKLRIKLGEDMGTIEPNVYKFVWITDFPFYERDEETGTIEFSHNPFSMPQGGVEALETKDPLDIHAYQYDLVGNGYELVSGAIRNHEPAIMYKAFEIAGYPHEEVDRRFGGMIRAFKFGAPPHGGMAAGVDRIVMLLAEELAIRDVIPFPLAQSVEDLLMGAPSEVSEKQLKEAHIVIRKPEPKA